MHIICCYLFSFSFYYIMPFFECISLSFWNLNSYTFSELFSKKSTLSCASWTSVVYFARKTQLLCTIFIRSVTCSTCVLHFALLKSYLTISVLSNFETMDSAIVKLGESRWRNPSIFSPHHHFFLSLFFTFMCIFYLLFTFRKPLFSTSKGAAALRDRPVTIWTFFKGITCLKSCNRFV